MSNIFRWPLNLQDFVAPGIWSPQQFEAFSRMSIEEEFDAIAPLFIYFEADAARKKEAREAAGRLAAVEHPVLAGMSAQEVVEAARTPSGLAARYNALLWVLVERQIPECEAYIDEHGAYAFRVPGDETLLAGDASGTFAYYASAKELKKRLSRAANTELA